ncbi:recombinase family protein [Streptomyces sp. NPDC048385]|uniref:recombinase family protein n=1 Tax=Streptomyces sp. NPDC048385 TaxID=3155145 RepID=UPI003429A9B7
MANLVHKRGSTDQKSTARQNLVLDEAGIKDPVVFEEDPGTSSRLHPLERPKFGELLTYARPGDTVHISELFRLVRGTQHILDVLDVLHHDRLALRIHDGAFSAMDLIARHPRTGELLSRALHFREQNTASRWAVARSGSQRRLHRRTRPYLHRTRGTPRLQDPGGGRTSSGPSPSPSVRFRAQWLYPARHGPSGPAHRAPQPVQLVSIALTSIVQSKSSNAVGLLSVITARARGAIEAVWRLVQAPAVTTAD